MNPHTFITDPPRLELDYFCDQCSEPLTDCICNLPTYEQVRDHPELARHP